MTVRGKRRPAAGLRAVLGLQFGIVAVLLLSDFMRVLPDIDLPFGPRAPDFTTQSPLTPGDQTRRFRPSRLPGLPGMEDMPSRLFFDVGTDPAVVRMTGSIQPGDADRFAEWLDGRPTPPERVELSSPGGSVDDALRIGRQLRELEVATEVSSGSICLSACPYILAGGTEREVSTEGFVGVHQHAYDEGVLLPMIFAVEDIQRGQSEVVAYLDDMGIDLRIMEPALATPAREIYLLVPEELRDFGLATVIAD